MAIGVARRDDAILVIAIPGDDGSLLGWRPFGGSIELGERAEQTVARELQEELGADVEVRGQLGVLQHIYRRSGHIGHEVMFVFAIELRSPGLAAAEAFTYREADGSELHAAWRPLTDFTEGREILVPEGLLALIDPPA